MLADYIKFYFIFGNSIYISLRIINHPINKQLHKIIFAIITVFFAFISTIGSIYFSDFPYAIPLMLLWIVIGLYTNKPKEAFIACTISFGLSYSMYSVACAFALLLIAIFFYNSENFPFEILAILTSTIQSVAIYFLLKIKRFRKGMPFLFSTSFINTATFLTFTLMYFTVFVKLNRKYLVLQISAFMVFSIITAFLIHWWQAQITKSYKHSLLIRELESLRVELQEKDSQLATLKTQNEDLGRIIHQDNKRIPAMENAVCEYLVSDLNDVNELKEKGNTLLVEIQNLSSSRTNTLSEIYAKKFTQYSTGITSLDTLLNYMDKRAREDKIQLSVHNSLDLNQYVPKCISTDDFVHLLSDLLENALIATKGCDAPIVQLQFYVSEKHFVIEVADNGIPFEAISIVNFGVVQLTTHGDTGGSGIGLMDIWRHKEKHGATLHIEEYETATPFTKKISLVFNKKNLYSVRTWRIEEINALSKRSDLRIYD